MEVHGIADYVICHGRVVVEEGNVRAVSGMGKFVPTPSHSPYVFGRVQERDMANAPQKVWLVFGESYMCTMVAAYLKNNSGIPFSHLNFSLLQSSHDVYIVSL